MPMATPEAQREYQRQWVAHRRTGWFADKQCVKCESTDDLQLDHIDPTQKISNTIWSWSAARRDTEIAKCQVLCAPCHKVKTRENRDILKALGTDPEEHGLKKYWRDRCRCVICRAGAAADKRAERARKRGVYA